MSEFTIKFFHSLKDIRIKRGYTQREVAEKAAIHQSFLSSIEGGKTTNLRLETIEKIINALGVTIDIRYEKSE
jgi:transcriptional regulator with XRE-family HTH domain